MKKKVIIGLLSIITATTLAACNAGEEGKTPNTKETEVNHDMDHSMNHSSSGEIPEGLSEANNPTYPVGSQATIKADHMEGMDGAVATIVGAFDTTVYAVSYTPTTGGEPVKDHKWVIHEELDNPGDAPLEIGAEVKLHGDHMDGMKGATATIDTAEVTTVYMVDYTDTMTGEEVTNHKWVVESELSPEK